MAHIATAWKKPFIVDAPAPMLKRNEQLSKNARRLYLTMRALANGQTGELKINGKWLRAATIDSAAEMCRDVRMESMRELIALGLVTAYRERVLRFVGGRLRSVLGKVHYIVYREAITPEQSDASVTNHAISGDAPRKITENPNILQQSISSTVEEIDSQDLSNPPTTVGLGSVGVCGKLKKVGKSESSSSAPSRLATIDDDSNPCPDWDLIESTIEKHKHEAKTTLLLGGWAEHIIDAALDYIEQRSDHSGSIPASANYFLAAFNAAIADPRDKKVITKHASQRARLRLGLIELTAVARKLEQESKASGRPLKEILELRAHSREARDSSFPPGRFAGHALSN